MDLTEFQQKISKIGKPVITDFWAPWCIPCRMTKPILEKLAIEYSSRVDFLPVNADESPELLQHYQVAGIPTVIAFRDGNLVERVIGAQGEARFRVLFESLSQGKKVKASTTPFSRVLSLIAGATMVVFGITSGYWFVAVAGGIVAFLGVYDRCPIWAALTRKLKRE
jgi:thioredoxin 1